MPDTLIHPYLFFSGQCEEALAFYRGAVGAEVVMMMRFGESPEPHPEGMVPPGYENKVMHATVTVGGAIFMASDGAAPGTKFSGFSLSLALPTEDAAHAAFAALAAGGSVGMPLAKTFWSPCFGMLTDQFGVGWMISVAGQN